MRKIMRIFVPLLIGFSMLACNLGGALSPSTPTAAPAAPTTAAPTAAVATTPAATPTAVVLEPCSLVTSADVEAILGEPASAPRLINGGCTFTNAKDSLYAFTVAAVQEQEAGGVLQGQAMLLGFAGAKLDEARMNKLKLMAAALDYKGFFNELIAAAEGSPAIQARLIENGGSDLVYWAWLTAQTRRQGAFVALRGATLVNINLVVADTQTEAAMLAASTTLADQIFGRLPARFTLPSTTPAAPAQPDVQATPTLVPSPTLIPSPTLVPPVGLPAPTPIAPINGIVLDTYPRLTTLEWTAVPGASKYVVEIEGCNNSKPTECFPHPMYEKTSRETNQTTYTFKFLGKQPGRWRVWAVDGSGQDGEKSAWQTFAYSR